jgi:hypothetical protein
LKPTQEQFEEWRSSPITEWLFDTFVPAEMLRTRESYQNRAWEGGADEVAHATHRERYETLDWLRGLDMTTIDEVIKRSE